VAPGWSVPLRGVPPLFQAVSPGRGPMECRLVPPTPVTNGWLDGSSTPAWLWGTAPPALQSSAPLSPDAATIDCPWIVACSKSVFSAPASAAPSADSHCPQEIVTTRARSWLTIALKVSYGPEPGEPELELGPW
jgi:hypothetical protein